MSGEILEEFHKARRESRKLSLALAALRPSVDLTEEDREELLRYLGYRKRSAVMELIRQGDLEGLRSMRERDWLEPQYLAGYRAEAVKLREMEIWACLCENGNVRPPGEKTGRSGGSGAAAASVLCGRIWMLTGKKLRMKLPGMAGILSSLKFRAEERIRYLAGDGFSVYYEKKALLSEYAESPAAVARGLLHLILHNLFFHPVLSDGREERLWNLACDIQAERMLDRWAVRGLSRDGEDYRGYLLKENGLPGRWKSTEELYRILQEKRPPEAGMLKLEEAFRVDDHRLWKKFRKKEKKPPEDSGKESGASSGRAGVSESIRFVRKWNRLRKETGFRPDGSHQKAGTAAGGAAEQVSVRRRKGYDYRRFLERFMICREEVEVDLDSFDYLPYWYSRTHYQGIVFLEPLEYREIHRLDEMMIAIDTSGSCSGQVVRRFLEETYRILSERGNFFQRMRVHIVQCDSAVQEYTVVHSRDEFLDYMERVTVKGMGGTDFRPVFRLADRLIAGGRIAKLKGLLYFTDGDGVYPAEKPAYETAFIFLNSQYEKQKIPEWAIRLNLGLKLEDE